jgi:hypothetical protein
MHRTVSLACTAVIFSFALAQPLAAATADWIGSLAYELNAHSPRLPNGQAVFRLRYRGTAGDEVMAILSGSTNPNGQRSPVRGVQFEYDASGTGIGEWEPAQTKNGLAAFSTRVPASGVLDFRACAADPGQAQKIVVEFSVRTADPQPMLFSLPKETADSVVNGRTATYNVYLPRAGARHEFEIRSEGPTPRLMIHDANGGGSFSYDTLQETGTVGHYRFLVPAEGKYQLKINLADYAAGTFLLRHWPPARLQRR